MTAPTSTLRFEHSTLTRQFVVYVGLRVRSGIPTYAEACQVAVECVEHPKPCPLPDQAGHPCTCGGRR